MNNSVEITIVNENEQIYQVPVDLGAPVEQLQRIIEFETSIPIKDQVLLFEGKELVSNKLVSDYNIRPGDLVFLRKKQVQQPQQQQQQQQQRPIQQQQQRQPIQQQQQQRGANPFKDVKTLLNYFKNSPNELEALANSNPQLADAILTDNEPLLQQYVDHYEKQRRLEELASDPFNEEGQRLLYEAIQRENIEHNMNHAIEHTPEVFGRVIMLYIDCKINDIPIKAFVDTGAQQSIMTVKCAERCGLMRLVDTRFHGIAKGVGTAKIVGRVHATKIHIGNSHFNIALSVLDSPGQDTEFILGLDMLKRHQCMVNLKTDHLEIGQENVPFLHEKDLSAILKSDDPLPENYIEPTTNNNNNNTTTTTTTSPPNNNNNPISPIQPTVAKPPPLSNVQSPPQNVSFPEESINMLVSLGASRQKAITLLTRSRGNVDAAASLFFGM